MSTHMSIYSVFMPIHLEPPPYRHVSVTRAPISDGVAP